LKIPFKPNIPIPILKGIHNGVLKYVGAYYISFSMINSRGIIRFITQLFYYIDHHPGALDLFFLWPGMDQKYIILNTITKE